LIHALSRSWRALKDSCMLEADALAGGYWQKLCGAGVEGQESFPDMEDEHVLVDQTVWWSRSSNLGIGILAAVVRVSLLLDFVVADGE